jgi:Ran GTPase-activating protein (RanGAP) involved in mRNA processing and transport
VLNLWNNSIGVAGAQALARALHAGRTLRELNLRENSIGDAGTLALAAALSAPGAAPLETLRLRTNQIGPEGAEALARTLATNTALQLVELGANPIGERASAALATAAEASPPLPVALAAGQRLAFLRGHFAPECPIRNLPISIVRRILTAYPVAQGSRTWKARSLTVMIDNQ